jgi:hypothetical protein
LNHLEVGESDIRAIITKEAQQSRIEARIIRYAYLGSIHEEDEM